MELNNLNNNLLILGAGGHGRVVKETAEAIGIFEQIDFLDDQLDLSIGKCEDFQEYINDYSYGFVAIGNNEQRIRWIERLIEAGFNLPILVHPTAYVSPSAKLDTGCIVCSKA